MFRIAMQKQQKDKEAPGITQRHRLMIKQSTENAFSFVLRSR